MVSLRGGDQMEQANEFLTNHIFVIEREVFYGAEGNGIGENASVKQMDCVIRKQGGHHTMQVQWRGRGGRG